jgi:hypothetical protein
MTVVFFLEEASAKALLEVLLPRLFPPPNRLVYQFIVFEGKQDLDKNLTRKLRGYLAPDAVFVVLRDQDAHNCVALKAELVNLCRAGGKPHTLVRIACRELESWYLGDLWAVGQALQIPDLAAQQEKQPHRAPDQFPNPANRLEKLVSNYQKVTGSRAIGAYLRWEENCSASFRVFISGLRRVVGAHVEND